MYHKSCTVHGHVRNGQSGRDRKRKKEKSEGLTAKEGEGEARMEKEGKRNKRTDIERADNDCRDLRVKRY